MLACHSSYEPLYVSKIRIAYCFAYSGTSGVFTLCLVSEINALNVERDQAFEIVSVINAYNGVWEEAVFSLCS